MSSGSPARNGTSVEPGLAKIVVRPSRRNTSSVASGRSARPSRRRVGHGQSVACSASTSAGSSVIPNSGISSATVSTDSKLTSSGNDGSRMACAAASGIWV